MAAEKLTKQRLAQIILMLVILSLAFLERTYQNQTQTQEIDCVLSTTHNQPCVFSYNDIELIIRKNNELESRITVYPVLESWSVSANVSWQKEGEHLQLSHEKRQETIRLTLNKDWRVRIQFDR